MIIHTPPVASNLPIKTLVAEQWPTNITANFINFVLSPDRVEYDLVRLLFEAFPLSDFIVNIMEGETVKTGYTWSHFLQSLCDT